MVWMLLLTIAIFQEGNDIGKFLRHDGLVEHKRNMNKFNEANQCDLNWPADSESKALYSLKLHLIQINLP